jgi:hypothetical protein
MSLNHRAGGYDAGNYYAEDARDSRCTSAESGSGCKTISTGDNNEIHLAGPGCCYTGGYSGHQIAVEEMKVVGYSISHHFQSLVAIRQSLE